MLTKMTLVLTDSPSNTTQEVRVTAEAVVGLTQISDELSPAAQVLSQFCSYDDVHSINVFFKHT